MRLSEFIQEHMETLLEEWEESALIIAPDLKGADREALRDHAQEMLRFIARDIVKPQTEQEKTDRSRGQDAGNEAPGGAENHGFVRKKQGLSLTQVVLEHRALRASVIRLWGQTQDGLGEGDIDDLVRFDEAIDQLLGTAISSFSIQKEQEARLFETVLSFSPDPSGIFDTQGRLIYVNKAMADVLQTSVHEAVGKNLFELGISFAADLEDSFGHTVSTGKLSRKEVSFIAASGKELTYDCLLAPVCNQEGKIEAVAKTSRDITERKANEYRVWKNANFDSLTRIPNRRLFLDRLAQVLKESERTKAGFALLFIDLDRFKEANDQLGHSIGDLLLKRVAERIGSCVREMDTLARLGGDEFTIILKDIRDWEKIETIAGAILARLERPFRIQGHSVSISASIGATTFPTDGNTVDKLMRNADQAMYAAKQQGGNRCQLYDTSLQRVQSEHSTLTRELQLALSQNQLSVYYQPVVNLATGAICMAEALLRWNHPYRGLLTPVTFIGIAEQIGLVKSIDAFVLKEAVSHSREWRSQDGEPFPISINESPASFFTRTLIENWRAGFDKIDVTNSRITLELTENSLTNACAGNSDLIKSLEENGIGLAIDDFGIGQFSLLSLKECGVGSLKIDQAIVQNLRADDPGNSIADAIISMAHSLGLKVIAEGVETEAQRRYLYNIGCDYGQGFLFSEPLPQEEFHNLIRAGEAEAVLRC